MIDLVADDDANANDAAGRPPRRPTRPAPVVLVLALAVGAFGGWWGRALTTDEHRATPRVVEGWASQAGTSGGIGCCGDDPEHAGGKGYDVRGTVWRDRRAGSSDESWHVDNSVSPPCLPANKAAYVRLAVVDIAPLGHAPGTQAVAWLECL